MLASLILIIATAVTELSTSASDAFMFDTTLHNINYGEVVTEQVANDTKLKLDSRTACVKDDDGKHRSFVISAFSVDIDTQHPKFNERCLRGHVNCECVAKYKKRNEIFKKIDKMRRAWIDANDREAKNPRRFNSLLERRLRGYR